MYSFLTIIIDSKQTSSLNTIYSIHGERVKRFMIATIIVHHSTMPAFMEELRTWKRAEPTTRKRKRPRTMGPTGIFSSLF